MTKYTKLYVASAGIYLSVMTIGCLVMPTPGCCGEKASSTTHQQRGKTQMSTYEHIDAKSLKNMIDEHTPMMIFDARTEEWDDGRRIPGARSLPFDSTSDAIAQAAPDSDTLIVVYCGAYECPMGKSLAESLVSQGYTNVLEYAGGIKEWADVMHYPTEHDN